MKMDSLNCGKLTLFGIIVALLSIKIRNFVVESQNVFKIEKVIWRLRISQSPSATVQKTDSR